MPKETIRVDDAVVRQPGRDTLFRKSSLMPFVTVGWGRRSATVNVAMASNVDDPSVTEALPARSVEMTRDQINELIRTLRKARDGAFGRDE